MFSNQLVWHDLQGSNNEDPSRNTKEDIHLCVDALEEVIIGQTFRLATDTSLENLCIGCGRCNIKSTVWEWWEVGGWAVYSSIYQVDENLGWSLVDENSCQVSKGKYQEGKGSTTKEGCTGANKQ